MIDTFAKREDREAAMRPFIRRLKSARSQMEACTRAEPVGSIESLRKMPNRLRRIARDLEQELP